MPAKRRTRGAAKGSTAPAEHTEARPGPETADQRGTTAVATESNALPRSPDADIGAGDAAAEGPPSETGTYDGEAFDPALVDEEELPTESGGGVGRTKPGYTGGFNAMKSFQGQMYTGMAVGGSHTWNYQPGVWKETKKEPDLWEINYTANKVRNRRAPAGSGAPVGTEYHWYIVAHQIVKKVDANTYETHLTGSKYKLTHKNVNQKQWAIPTVKGQRERELFLLEDAKRRVQGLPPVLSNEKVKVERHEKGQSTLASFFVPGEPTPKKRKVEEGS